MTKSDRNTISAPPASYLDALFDRLGSADVGIRASALIEARALPVNDIFALIDIELRGRAHRDTSQLLAMGWGIVAAIGAAFLLRGFGGVPWSEGELPILMLVGILTGRIVARSRKAPFTPGRTCASAAESLGAIFRQIDDPGFIPDGLAIIDREAALLQNGQAAYDPHIMAKIREAVGRLRPKLRLEQFRSWSPEQRAFFVERLTYADVQGILSHPGAIREIGCRELFDPLLTLAVKPVARDLTPLRTIARGMFLDTVVPELLAEQGGAFKSPQIYSLVPKMREMIACPFLVQLIELIPAAVRDLPVGFDLALGYIEHLTSEPAETGAERAVRRAARKCLTILQARSDIAQQAKILLRASSADSAMASQMLLRPAASTSEAVAPDELLRPLF